MASQNRTVNDKGKIIYSGSGPKDQSRGADLGKDATNKKATWGCSPAEASPSATPQTRNKNTGEVY